MDEDAKSKLREIIEKRAEDKNEILVPWRLTPERWELWGRGKVVALFPGMKGESVEKMGFWFALLRFFATFCASSEENRLVLFEQIRQRVCRVSIVGRVCKWS